MNAINSNYPQACGNMQQEEIRNRNREYSHGYKSIEEKPQENIQPPNTDNAGFSPLEVYESMSGKAKMIPEADQGAAGDDQAGPKKVIEMGVVSLIDMGISFLFNMQTGEVSCVNDNDPNSGVRVLWSKQLSDEEMTKCDALFENYPNFSKGYFEYRYKAYLKHEEFWDMYLEDKIDLKTLEWGSSYSDDELYDRFLQDMKNSDI